MPELNQEYLKSILHYDFETGLFTWLVNKSFRCKIGDIAGRFNDSMHRCICIDGKQLYAHRLAWLWMTGEWPKNLIDHKDNNPSNNKWENLREATRSQNGKNSKVRITNKLGIKGISKNRSGYLVRICLGTYDTIEEAIEVYNKAILKYYGEFAKLSEKPQEWTSNINGKWHRIDQQEQEAAE
jgi:prefoldin subunit 5